MQPLVNTSDKPAPVETIASRLFGLLASMLEGEDGDSPIPAMYHPIILNMVRGFLKRTKEPDLRILIEKLRDELIPWILGDGQNPK